MVNLSKFFTLRTKNQAVKNLTKYNLQEIENTKLKIDSMPCSETKIQTDEDTYHQEVRTEEIYKDLDCLRNPLNIQARDSSFLSTSRQNLLLNEGDVVLDNYQVIKKLGQGGMGAVYLVENRFNHQRYAAKISILAGESKGLFLDELEVWIGLPPHPNITECRFFRTVHDQVWIFSEYIDGGSLANQIRNETMQIDQILDIAIQFAWGLSTAHSCGIIHQDIKPANTLISKNGIVKICDFGLAKAKRFVHESVDDNQDNFLVSVGGMTRAYRSPEQANREKLTPKTDIWSFGVSILQMFTRKVTWSDGQYALTEGLEQHLVAEKNLPSSIPQKMEQIIRNCLAPFEERYSSMLEVAKELELLYEEITHTKYPRTSPDFQKDNFDSSKKQTGQKTFRTPQLWKQKALLILGEENGKEPHQTSRQSRKSQVVASIASYEKIQTALENLIANGKKDLEEILAGIYVEKALVHKSIEDFSGTLSLYDKAIAIRKKLVESQASKKVVNGLANSYIGKAAALNLWGKGKEALLFCEKAIAIREDLVTQQGQEDFASDLAKAYTNKAVILDAQGKGKSSISFYNQAIAIYEKLLHGDENAEIRNDLANAYMNKANALYSQGKGKEAISFYDKAITIRKNLVQEQGFEKFAYDLANTYMNKSNALYSKGQKDALSYCDQAIAIYKGLVEDQGREDLASDFANAYINKAVILYSLGKGKESTSFCHQAITIYKKLVEDYGREELSHDLAKAYMNNAVALYSLGKGKESISCCNQAITIYKRLVEIQKREEFANDLANVYMNKASALYSYGQRQEAILFYDQAIAIREKLVEQQNREELANDLAKAYMNKAVTLDAIGKTQEAIAFYDQAIAIREKLVEQQNREELADGLAKAYMNKAKALDFQGQGTEALSFYDRAITIYKELVEQQSRDHSQGGFLKKGDKLLLEMF